MAKVIIFGLRDFAQFANFYFKHDSEHEVVAFTVSRSYLPETPEFEGKPVVAFEDIERQFSPLEYKMFAPMSHARMNRTREGVYNSVKQKGYSCISYVSSKATVWPGAVIGENCFILEDNTIQPFTPIGNNVMLWSGNHIGHHGRIHDHVLFTSHVVLSGHCTVEPYCVFGVNSTIRDGVRIAQGSFIAMGAAVTRDTEEWGVYKGTPAKKGDVLSKDMDI